MFGLQRDSGDITLNESQTNFRRLIFPSIAVFNIVAQSTLLNQREEKE